MPGETPDWGVLSAQATVYPVNDMGELAVRLGSPISHDRAGDVIWWDDFEWGLAKWAVDSTGTGGSVALTTASARNGRRSCRLTAGSSSGRDAGIIHEEAFSVPSNLGWEYSFRMEASIESIEIYNYGYSGALQMSHGLKWDGVLFRLLYWDVTNTWVEFAPGVQLEESLTLFHTLKVVASVLTGEYVRAVVDSVEYDLRGKFGSEVASGTLAKEQVAIYLVGAIGQNDFVDVDDVILTQNEPA